MMPNKKHFEFRQLGPHDVLLGRGTGTNEYIGNVRFRESIRGIVDDSSIEKFDGHAKTELALLIVARIKEFGGKFVKKVSVSTTANKEGTGSSLDGVYEEVRDSVACDKVTQCIRHQLRSPKTSSSSSSSVTTAKITSSKKKINARLPASKANKSLASKTSTSTLPQQSLRSPALLTAVLPEMCLPTILGERPPASSQLDLLQHHMQFAQAPPTVDSQAIMLKEYYDAMLFPNLSRRDHVATASPHSIADALPTLHGATNQDQNLLLQLLLQHEQESALLQNALMVRRNKNKILEQWLGAQPSPFGAPAPPPLTGLPSSSATLQAVLAHELASGRHRLQASSGGGTFFPQGPSSMIPPPFF